MGQIVPLTRLPLVLCGLLAVCAFPAHAELHKCSRNGATGFQDTPCQQGQEAAGAEELALRERLRADRADLAADRARAIKILDIKACVAHADCDAAHYRELVSDLKMAAYVEEALGKPESVQVYRDRELHYYVVPTTGERKKAMLQIRYSADRRIQAANWY
ncbi:MAG: hypothetical protein KF778_19980 [Rhodocyclaceae bacterium]|nr:hypothetical protein [Rhodocyclaceae bacterium]MBX3670688.1 hypothetical protein [Rhodocyclaceae bacterium]